jgi:hypothetical protein
MSITCVGEIKLSRNVVFVELSGQLKVGVVASHVDNRSNVVVKDMALFTPLKASFCRGTYDLGFVRWKLLLLGLFLQLWRTCALYPSFSLTNDTSPKCIFSIFVLICSTW